MDCELDIIDGLTALAYKGGSMKNDVLGRALEGGPRSAEFREVVGWLAHELHVLRKTDEHVAETEDANEFAMELSAMLKELGCPYGQFVTGPLSERFEKREACAQLVDYLVTELMATKMSLRLRPAEQTYIIPKFETNTARALEQLTRDLGLGKPPENVTPKAYFDKLNFKVEDLQRQVKPGVLSDPLLSAQKPLSDAQWQQLEEMHNKLDAEYNLRRQMLLTRLEVTIQSFQWSDSMRKREKEIIERFQKKLAQLEPLRYGGVDTNIVAFLSARADMAVIEKTSSANVRKNTASKVQKHVIGSVPDRGGRAHEHAPPPPEMPSWQQQRSSGPGGRGGGFGGGGGRGGGRGGGGGGSWQQYSSAPQQRPQQYDQRPQFNQQQQHQQQRDQNWVTGSGRVQGSGWSQKGNDYNDRGGSNQYQGDGGGGRGGGGNNYHHGDGGGGRGGGNNYRGSSNYNRGGGGGGRR